MFWIVHISISQSFKHGGNVFHYINTLHEILEFNWTTSTGILNQLLKIFRIYKKWKTKKAFLKAFLYYLNKGICNFHSLKQKERVPLFCN